MVKTQRELDARTRPGRRKVVIAGASAAVVVIVGGLALYSYVKLSGARDDLDRASTGASQLRDALVSGDQPRSKALLAQLQSDVGSARSSLDDPVLSLASKTPFFGKNVSAVRTITSSVGTVVDDALPPLVDVADRFSAKSFSPEDGRIDLDVLSSLTPSLTNASTAIDAADAEARTVDAGSLLGAVQRPVADAQKTIADAAAAARRAVTATTVVPQVLSGKHTYLLIFQNNAEIRATGGLPGAFATIEVDDGRLKLTRQGSGAALGDLPEPAAEITPEEKNLFSDLMVTDFRDVNFTPDFPRAAQIASAIVEKSANISIDGVLSVDPVTLSYLLEGTGPVELDGGVRLTADNAVEVLLNAVYVNYADPDDQDDFFARATKKLFDTLISGTGDPTTILRALGRAGNERRIAVWSKDAKVQTELADTPLPHALPTGEQASPALGFYLDDATGAKMQYYLGYSLAGRSTKCTSDGTQSFTAEMTLRSSAPADSATLPVAIRGPGFGADPGSMLMNLYLYGADGGTIGDVKIDGEETTFTRATHEGRPVVIVTIQVNPGQTVKLTTTGTSGPGQKGSTRVDLTPSIVPGPSVQTWRSAC